MKNVRKSRKALGERKESWVRSQQALPLHVVVRLLVEDVPLVVLVLLLQVRLPPLRACLVPDLGGRGRRVGKPALL